MKNKIKGDVTMRNIFKERILKSTSLCMELTEEISSMKNGESPDYDYALSLVKEIHKNQMELIDEVYKNQNDCRVEIPDFMRVV